MYSAVSTYDELGQRLYLFACLLTDDTDLAEQLVLRAVRAHQHERRTLKSLSVSVYDGWIARGSPPLVHEVHGLPADQRAALGLCAYGDHDYRLAAAVLILAPDLVARLLGDALRALGRPDASPALSAGSR